MRIIILLSLVLIFVSKSTFGQTYYFDNYSVKEGLAQSKVYTVLQDETGYFWMGTESGVSRFDGINFLNYTSDNGLAESGIQTILIDNSNNIWFGHVGGGISRMKNIEFEKIILDTLVINVDITDIKQDSVGNIWISTHGEGVFKITNPDANNGSLKYVRYRGLEGLSDRVFKMVLLKSGYVNFLTDVGIKFYNPTSDSFSFFKLEGIPRYFLPTTMIEDTKGDLWFGTHNGGLYHYTKKNDVFKIFDKRDGLAHNFISCIHEDKKGNIWAGTWGGGISKISDTLPITFDTSNGLQDNKIRSITEDREGNILIGTNENGLSVFKGVHFTHYSQDNGIAGKQGLSILQTNDGIYWFGTDIALSSFDNKTKTIKTFDSEFILQDQIAFLKKDKNENIWIGTRNNGVVMYNTQTEKFTYNAFLNNLIKQYYNLIMAMEIDSNNNLWIGTIGGLIYYEIYNEKYALLTQRNGLAGVDISALYADKKGTIWVGSKGKGITKIVDTTFTVVESDRNISPTCFTEDKNGNIWVGTESHGIVIVTADSISKQYKVQNGLLSDNITLLNTDKYGNIFIGTNLGLNKFGAKEQKFYTYTQKNGFTGIEVKNNASLLDRNGNLWFGTVAGFTKYEVDKEFVNTLEPKTNITRFRINLNDREMTDNLVLNYQQNSLVFDYVAICLANPKSVKYQVMLEGVDHDWSPTTTLTQANYPALAPGKYTFKIKASNNIDIWNANPVTFSFRIAPPFWKSWWFMLISTTVGVLIIVSYIKIRERNLINEKNRLEKNVAERTAEISQKNKELAEKNQSILDSIRYAKRIQDALLPSNDILSKFFSDYFILFKPRDIVSGDFYWALRKENTAYFIAADCTGHGVPGGFMSMLGIAFLNEIVNSEINNAGNILDQLRNYVISSLKQTGKKSEPQDGMDLTLCIVDYDKMQMQIAAANNEAYLVRNGNTGKETELITIKPDKMPIGIYYQKITPFNNQIFDIKLGDKVYFSSDGYKDQFGGDQGRKFMAKNFKTLLLSIQDKPMIEQKSILESTLKNWMGKLEQVDDVLVAGIMI